MGPGPGPALVPAPHRRPSSHPLDLKQLHIRVIPDGWVHIPVEGAGGHRVLGGLTGEGGGVCQGVVSPDPSHRDVPPWAVGAHPQPDRTPLVDCLDINPTTMVGPRTEAHAETHWADPQMDTRPTQLVTASPPLPTVGPTSDR